MKKKIVLLPGDGIGPEVTQAAATVLRETAHEFHHEFEFVGLPVGGAAIDATGAPLPPETLDVCRKADAVFLGAVGGPKWDALPVGKRPESGLLGLRQGMELFVNVRPVKLIEPLRGLSPTELGFLEVLAPAFSSPTRPGVQVALDQAIVKGDPGGLHLVAQGIKTKIQEALPGRD